MRYCLHQIGLFIFFVNLIIYLISACYEVTAYNFLFQTLMNEATMVGVSTFASTQ